MSSHSQEQRIAIIGSGIAGLTAAYLLNREHLVTLFEANKYIGGHTHTVNVVADQDCLAVDTGFIVCNDRNYPNFLKLMGQVGVELKATEMSFSVRDEETDLEYNGHNLNTLFSQRRNLLRPRFLRLVGDILRFNKASKAAIAGDSIGDETLDDFVQSQGLGDDFRHNYLLPMVAAIWSCSINQAGAFPLRFFLQFFLNHGLLDIKNRPQWYVVEGGSSSYIDPLTRDFRQHIRPGTAVLGVSRSDDGVEVKTAQDSEKFDQVVFACHSDQALALLTDPSSAERAVLGDLEYQDNDVILHSDTSLMPRKSRSWASWNFRAGTVQHDEPPLVTYCMNILQGFQSSKPMLVSLNARHKIDPQHIMREFRYAHPVYSRKTMSAQSRRDEICGKERTHYCGAYWYSGFHEDGVCSALDVCQRFGLTL